jgi:hypothetical protein
MLVPPHHTDPLTASIAPLISWILHWPVVHDMLPFTLSESSASTDMLQLEPTHVTEDIRRSIAPADIATGDADTAIGPLTCSVDRPFTSMLPASLDPCMITFEPSSRIASPHDRHRTLLLPVSCTAPLPEKTLRSCTPAVPVTLPLTWPSRTSTCTTSPDKALLESIDKVRARASLLPLLLLMSTFAFATMLRKSSWTPDRSLGYGV